MRSNGLSKLIVAIGTMALAIALTINAASAAPRVAPTDEALLLNRHDPRFTEASDAQTVLDGEQTRIKWSAISPVAAAQNSTGRTLNQQTRDAILARWLARHGGTNRTCVLLCGGR